MIGKLLAIAALVVFAVQVAAWFSRPTIAVRTVKIIAITPAPYQGSHDD